MASGGRGNWEFPRGGPAILRKRSTRTAALSARQTWKRNWAREVLRQALINRRIRLSLARDAEDRRTRALTLAEHALRDNTNRAQIHPRGVNRRVTGRQFGYRDLDPFLVWEPENREITQGLPFGGANAIDQSRLALTEPENTDRERATNYVITGRLRRARTARTKARGIPANPYGGDLLPIELAEDYTRMGVPHNAGGKNPMYWRHKQKHRLPYTRLTFGKGWRNRVAEVRAEYLRTTPATQRWDYAAIQPEDDVAVIPGITGYTTPTEEDPAPYSGPARGA